MKTKSATLYCLDFYFYLKNIANDTSISFGWNTKTAKQMIIEVTSHIDNRWQHSRSTYKSPSSESYQIWFKMKRMKGSIALFHALDEIKIFEGSCDTQLIITNGTEFTSSDLSQPPGVPLLDATSINEPTGNNQKCKLPYQLSIDNSTNTSNWDMWFCYNNQCPTNNEDFSTCTLANYGLISIEPWETNKTISTLINENMITRDFVGGEQCLLYYYYITLDDDIDYGQQLSVSIRSDNISDSEIEIDRLSIVDMKENRWHSRNVTFNSTSTSYTVIYI
ncbi:unnamed protein product [Adineta steineri]|uniref:MAM domain-containing protein n=1 Tax=Adineta steineri TaxID=433720 RepID=A0A814MUP1_9BILA|nr:unnamed protein product [Adineta steineri]CAF3779846.1 unnamed protein product [Adineta steineri]